MGGLTSHAFLSGGKRRRGQRNPGAKLALEEAYVRWYINKEFERPPPPVPFLSGIQCCTQVKMSLPKRSA